MPSDFWMDREEELEFGDALTNSKHQFPSATVGEIGAIDSPDFGRTTGAVRAENTDIAYSAIH